MKFLHVKVDFHGHDKLKIRRNGASVNHFLLLAFVLFSRIRAKERIPPHTRCVKKLLHTGCEGGASALEAKRGLKSEIRHVTLDVESSPCLRHKSDSDSVSANLLTY